MNSGRFLLKFVRFVPSTPATVQKCLPGSSAWSNIVARRQSSSATVDEEQGEDETSAAFSSSPLTMDEYRSHLDAIRARGFLKTRHSYNPPPREQLLSMIRECAGGDSSDEVVGEQKAQILMALSKRLNHRVPNSALHEINTIEDILQFYSAPVANITSYDSLAREKQRRPVNLHIREEPVRFHPQLDSRETAFPKSSTIVKDLRAQRLYEGFRAKSTYHHNKERDFDYHDESDLPWNVDLDPSRMSVKYPEELRLGRIVMRREIIEEKKGNSA